MKTLHMIIAYVIVVVFIFLMLSCVDDYTIDTSTRRNDISCYNSPDHPELDKPEKRVFSGFGRDFLNLFLDCIRDARIRHDEYGGWDKSICIKGSRCATSYYQRIIFTDTLQGVIHYACTKNAYEIGALDYCYDSYHSNEQQHNDKINRGAGGDFGVDWDFTVICRYKSDARNLHDETWKWVRKKHCFIFPFNVIFSNQVRYSRDRIATTVCKEEFDRWMIKHPETEILKY